MELTKLPAGMRMLYLSDNQFSGIADVTALPPCMVEVALDRNRFSGFGVEDRERLPKWIKVSGQGGEV